MYNNFYNKFKLYILKLLKNNLIYFIILATGFIGFYIGLQYNLPDTKPAVVPIPNTNTNQIHSIRFGNYKYINPLLLTDVKSAEFTANIPLIDKMKYYINEEMKSGDVNEVSVYIRDLTKGTSIKINDGIYFSPASLLKVSVMIAILKKSETDVGLLKKKFKYKMPYNEGLTPNINDLKIVPGNYYSVEELLYKMIVYSDNDARKLLIENIDITNMDGVLNILGFYNHNVNGEYLIKVDDYASLFRILYNATYLNETNSEKALKILSETTFRNGIVKYIPSEISVSHKFGERAYSNSDIKQLHDCGIVYKTKVPYLICVMTSGKDFSKLSEVIARLSKMVYFET